MCAYESRYEVGMKVGMGRCYFCAPKTLARVGGLKTPRIPSRARVAAVAVLHEILTGDTTRARACVGDFYAVRKPARDTKNAHGSASVRHP